MERTSLGANQRLRIQHRFVRVRSFNTSRVSVFPVVSLCVYVCVANRVLRV